MRLDERGGVAHHGIDRRALAPRPGRRSAAGGQADQTPALLVVEIGHNGLGGEVWPQPRPQAVPGQRGVQCGLAGLGDQSRRLVGGP
jgi:hypothetical protein